LIKKTLYFENPAYISTKYNQLVVKYPEVEKNFQNELSERFSNSIPIEDIGTVIFDNQQITITQGALVALSENNCAVITCGSNRMPSGLLLPISNNTLQGERYRHQINSSLPLKKNLWQQTVQSKIQNQALLLKTKLDVETLNMFKWIKDVKSGDASNIEARAAVYYWSNLFPEEISFFRDRNGLPPNNLLNYGYSILRSIIARSLIGSGLLLSLGIHHKNRYNAFALADDIMEPYRPFVDDIVLDIVLSGCDYSEISKEIKIKLLSLPTIDVEINSFKRPLSIATSITTSSLYKCFAKEASKIEYPVFSL